MGAVAVAAVRKLGYEGAGTLEFLLDGESQFYFMEMNTRLQVEHPVTEAITGLDLVELQLRIAAGEPLPLKQEDVRFRGHAMEARLCAEDADQSFMPRSGTMALWQPPHGLRVEHALKSGAEIPPFYDSMIAKLVSHGATRDEARRKLVRGLEELAALGVKTNQGFLIRCVEHPAFAGGAATTSFIGDHLDALSRRDEDSTSRARALAAVLLIETAAGAAHRGAGRKLSYPLPVGLRFELDGKVAAATLIDLGGRKHRLTIEVTDFELDVVEVGNHAVRFVCTGLMESAVFLREDGRLLLRYRGEAYEVEDTTRAATARRGAGGSRDGKLRALMNGRVVGIFAAVGDRVEAGAPLLSLEAMKMVHVHAAPVSGVLKALHVAEGDQAPASRVVAEIQPDEPGEPA
jgi:geranyl-CoA carboxylase alpha subunit